MRAVHLVQEYARAGDHAGAFQAGADAGDSIVSLYSTLNEMREMAELSAWMSIEDTHTSAQFSTVMLRNSSLLR